MTEEKREDGGGEKTKRRRELLPYPHAGRLGDAFLSASFFGLPGTLPYRGASIGPDLWVRMALVPTRDTESVTPIGNQ
ncbi:unnamed protein product [Boreogadus saida]